MSVRNHSDQQADEISCLIRLYLRVSVYFAISFISKYYRPERVKISYA